MCSTLTPILRWTSQTHQGYNGTTRQTRITPRNEGPSTFDRCLTLGMSLQEVPIRQEQTQNLGQARQDKTHRKPDDKGKSPAPSNNQGSSKNNKNKPGNKPAKPALSSAGSSSFSNKLGKDGKLTPQEHQHCFNNNFYLFCGGSGHTMK